MKTHKGGFLMVQHAHTTIISVILLAVHCIVLAGTCSAEDLTVKLVINPKKTDVYLGSAPIALTAKAKGKNLTFTWELVGPGTLEGKSSAMFYTLPEKIDGTSAQALITVIVIDETGQELRESVTFNILPRIPTPTSTPSPTPTPTPATTPTAKRGIGTGTKVALGAGAVAALGGGITLALGGGDDEGATGCVTSCGGVMVGCYCWYLSNTYGSCTQVCASHGGYHEATRTYAGSDGTDSNCWEVLVALGAPPDADGILYVGELRLVGLGCCYEGDGAYWYWY